MRRLLLRCTMCGLLCMILLGCGYTTGALLPASIKSIYVKTFTNQIDITAELSETSEYKIYSRLLEVDITKEIINRFIYDGNLRVVKEENADLVLRGELIDYSRQPLRYDPNDEVEEYRYVLTVNLILYNAQKEEVMWEEEGFIGDSTRFTDLVPGLATGEKAALTKAINDLARRIVERTIEWW